MGEQIIKLGRVCYMKLFDDFGDVVLNEEECFCDAKGEYDCKRIFWRFYWIYNRTYKD